MIIKMTAHPFIPSRDLVYMQLSNQLKKEISKRFGIKAEKQQLQEVTKLFGDIFMPIQMMLAGEVLKIQIYLWKFGLMSAVE